MKYRSTLNVVLSGMKEAPMPDGIAALYAYGSVVRGTFRNDSDIDIAMLPSYTTNDIERLRLMSHGEAIVRSALNKIGMRREVSILDMRGKYISLQLLYHIITEGIVLYQSATAERIFFELAVKREYFDFIPYLFSLRKRKYGDLYQKI